jgi:hypothetical protein
VTCQTPLEGLRDSRIELLETVITAVQRSSVIDASEYVSLHDALDSLAAHPVLPDRAHEILDVAAIRLWKLTGADQSAGHNGRHELRAKLVQDLVTLRGLLAAQ